MKTQPSRRTARKPKLSRFSRARNRQTTSTVVATPPLMPDWHGSAATLVGLAHLRHTPPQPCQDAACVVEGKRPVLIVADGAGSAALSHQGSQVLVNGLRRFLHTLADDYAIALDDIDEPGTEQIRKLALRPVKHGLGLLQDLASTLHHPVSLFRSTLIVAIGGRSRWLWLRIGDGALVIEENGQLQLIGQAGKGEYANQTQFIDEQLHPDHVQFGVFSSTALTGVAAMSDGTAERLVNLHTGQVAGQLGQFITQAQQKQLNTLKLHQFFAHAETWQKTTGDDRALAILAATS